MRCTTQDLPFLPCHYVNFVASTVENRLNLPFATQFSLNIADFSADFFLVARGRLPELGGRIQSEICI